MFTEGNHQGRMYLWLSAYTAGRGCAGTLAGSSTGGTRAQGRPSTAHLGFHRLPRWHLGSRSYVWSETAWGEASLGHTDTATEVRIYNKELNGE